MFGFLPRQSGCPRWVLRATTITLPVPDRRRSVSDARACRRDLTLPDRPDPVWGDDALPPPLVAGISTMAIAMFLSAMTRKGRARLHFRSGSRRGPEQPRPVLRSLRGRRALHHQALAPRRCRATRGDGRVAADQSVVSRVVLGRIWARHARAAADRPAGSPASIRDLRTDGADVGAGSSLGGRCAEKTDRKKRSNVAPGDGAVGGVVAIRWPDRAGSANQRQRLALLRLPPWHCPRLAASDRSRERGLVHPRGKQVLRRGS